MHKKVSNELLLKLRSQSFFLMGLGFTFLFLILGYVAHAFHFLNIWTGNSLTWISWILSMLFALITCTVNGENLRSTLPRFSRTTLILFFCSLIFFVSFYFYNFSIAPWNQDGLFDDAAWDIYFMKRYVLSDEPFQAAFYDHGTSRETFFHYYLALMLGIFGMNVRVFNIAVVVLSFFTLFFTTLLIQHLFKKKWISILSLLVLGTLPFQFLYSYVGHRYVINAPLTMISLYFVVTSFSYRSTKRGVIGGIFAGFSLASAIMGKQYILALLSSGLFLALLQIRTLEWKKILPPFFSIVLGFLCASAPLLSYIAFNPIYFLREKGLSSEFRQKISEEGVAGITPYFQQLSETFFSLDTGLRWFLPDYVPVPYPYMFLIILGSIILLKRKQFLFLAMGTIPILGALIAGAHDFRYLHAVPIWIIALASCFDIGSQWLEKWKLKKQNLVLPIIFLASLIIVVCAGFIPNTKYVLKISKQTGSLFHFNQHVVASSRYLRDIVANVPNPSTQVRANEFDKLNEFSPSPYQTYICQEWGYAIPHLFLYDYSDTEILKLCDNLPFNLMPIEDIFLHNAKTIAELNSQKDVKFIWQVTEKTEPVIRVFKTFERLGHAETLRSSHLDVTFEYYVLTIPKENIEILKNEIHTVPELTFEETLLN